MPLRNTLIIPQKATYEIQDKIYVFVVGNDHVARSKQITVYSQMPDLYVVSGLSATDKIMLEGVQKVKDDDKVNAEYRAPREVMAQLQLRTE